VACHFNVDLKSTHCSLPGGMDLYNASIFPLVQYGSEEWAHKVQFGSKEYLKSG